MCSKMPWILSVKATSHSRATTCTCVCHESALTYKTLLVPVAFVVEALTAGVRKAQRTSCLKQTRIQRKELISHCSVYMATIQRVIREPNCTFYSWCTAPCRLSSVRLKWQTGFTRNLHIYLRNDTSQAWQSGTSDSFPLCALVSRWVITRLSWFGLNGGAV